MSALSIQPTYPIFTETDGQPLENGYIWIGTVNLDPQVNPIAVYWDAALTQLAAQPIRTEGGYPVNNGTPARLYVNSDYSIRVMNKNGSVVYSAPATTERYSGDLVSLTGFKDQVGTVTNLSGDDGSDWIGFEPASADAIARSAQEKMRDIISILDFGADNTGVSNSTDAFLAAVDACDSIYVPSGTYKISSTIVIPANCVIYGDGPGNTSIDVTADAVAFQLSNFSQLRQLFISPSASHTKNLVEIGYASTNNAGRSVVSDVHVDSAGANGINLSYGNLGLLQNIKATNCGNDGIHLSAQTVDNNAWTLLGYIDVIGNTRDGLHIAGGTSVSDPTASRTHQISGVTAQENGNCGVYVNSRSNLIAAYCENNTFADVYLDTYAVGNEIKTTEGSVTLSTSDPSSNIVYNPNGGANYWRLFQTRTRFSGASTAGWMLSNDDGTAGQLTCSKLAAYTYGFTAEAATNETFKLTNSSPSGYLSLSVKGNSYGELDASFSSGLSTNRWSVVYAATGTINTSDANEKQDIAELNDAEKRVALKLKRLIRKFRFKDAVASKGSSARIHVGVIAQDVKAVFESENLNADEYGVFCSDTMEDGTTRLGIRYDELFAFVVSSI